LLLQPKLALVMYYGCYANGFRFDSHLANFDFFFYYFFSGLDGMFRGQC